MRSIQSNGIANKIEKNWISNNSGKKNRWLPHSCWYYIRSVDESVLILNSSLAVIVRKNAVFWRFLPFSKLSLYLRAIAFSRFFIIPDVFSMTDYPFVDYLCSFIDSFWVAKRLWKFQILMSEQHGWPFSRIFLDKNFLRKTRFSPFFSLCDFFLSTYAICPMSVCLKCFAFVRIQCLSSPRRIDKSLSGFSRNIDISLSYGQLLSLITNSL